MIQIFPNEPRLVPQSPVLDPKDGLDLILELVLKPFQGLAHLEPCHQEHLYVNHFFEERCNICRLVKKNKRAVSRQKSPKVYQMNGLHTYNVKKFLYPKRQIRTELNKALPLEIPIETGLMIDTEFEFLLAKLLIENNIWKF